MEAKYSDPELYLICGNGVFETNAPYRAGPFETSEEREKRFKWVDSFFESPICRECANAGGPRSNTPLTLEYVQPGHDGLIEVNCEFCARSFKIEPSLPSPLT